MKEEKKEERVIYFEDELNDEFSSAKIDPIKIDETYKYKHGYIWEFCSWFIQNIFSMPVKLIYSKAKFKIKFVGKEKFKQCKKQGFFIYGNHTQAFCDTFIPSLADYPKRNFLIVNPENVSMGHSGKLVEMLGAIPIPGNKTAMRNFLNRIENRIRKGYSVTIYPEAHIWPYYTKIRPFKDVSFKYPVQLDVPSFCITNTYQNLNAGKGEGENKKKEIIQIVTYIDGPFYPNKDLTIKEQQKELRDKIYECMSQRSKNSNVEYIKYVRKSEK